MRLQTIVDPVLPLIFLLPVRLVVATAKKLVTFSGPHETHTATNTFLSEYAANDGSGASAFDGWSWPLVDNEDIDSSPQHVFDFLVKEQDDGDIQDIVIDAIRSAWKTSRYGVFLGSLDFDKVGTNPYSGYDAVEALKRVVDRVGVSAEDVTVVVTYRNPRVNQWVDVWKNHFHAESYHDFICSDEQSKKRWEWVDTSMNPFKVAKAYHDQDWNVLVIDKESTIDSGKDVANVVACWAMENESCKDGWVNGLDRTTTNTSMAAYPIEELEDEDRSDLERLFLLRDCYYVAQLISSPRFLLFDKNKGFQLLGKECKNSLVDLYKAFSDTNFLMNAIQSQKYCEQEDIDVPSLLSKVSDSGVSNSDVDDDTGDDGDDDKDNDGSEYTSPPEDDTENGSQTSTDDDAEKSLIVFVGPHETEAVDVTNFFVNYASANGDSEPSSSLNGWNWPNINDERISKPSHRVFDLMVTDPEDEDLQSVVIGAIVDSWKSAMNGVVIGSLYFDRVGTNPYSNYDPIKALKRIIDALGISNDRVTVAVTYRSPRIDHWSAVWNNHFESNKYEDFICSDGEDSLKRWEWLDTVMNPFKIAKTYHDQGWDVAVVDQEGTINNGLEVAHTIACDLMKNVKCEGGWVTGLEDVVSDPLAFIPMDSLEEDDRSDLERIFRERDCYYKYELKDEPGFSILHQHATWSSCSEQHKSFYQQFTSTDFVLDLLKSQKQCGQNAVDISNMLEEKMVHDGNKHLIVFAGPHETSAIKVTKFFVDHASDEEGTTRSTSFGGWTWPVIDSEILENTQSHRTFDLLLSDAKTRPVQNIILGGIRDSWNNAHNGVIIGSLDLDKVGENPYSSYDALGAVERVVETLGISDDSVTIVLNYRSTRLYHLSAVWSNHFDAESFQEFICSDAQVEKRWEWMDTVMNPVKLANAYREEDWKVAMIDQEGTASAGRDVAHALACDLMNGVDCDRGWVRGLENETIESPSTYDIEDLDHLQRTQIETLFQMRDCYYKYTLESDNNFLTVNKDGLWKSCSLKNHDMFEKLADTDFLLEVMKSLQDCGDKSNLEVSSFASELLNPDRSSISKSHGSLIIAAVVLSTAFITLLGLLSQRTTRKKTQEAKGYPSEGIFRDDPHDPDQQESPYHENEEDVDEITNEERFDDEDDGSGSKATNANELGDVEHIHIERIDSNRDVERCIS